MTAEPGAVTGDSVPVTVRVQAAPDEAPANMGGLSNTIGESVISAVSQFPADVRQAVMLAELQVPNISPQSLVELRERAENIRQLAGDFRLDADATS